MTTPPVHAAVVSALLPSGRTILAGDCLTREEAQDLLFVQQGWTSLRPVAQSPNRYVVALSGSITPDMILGELFSGEPALTISELEAITLAEQWLETVELCVIPIPVGNGQFTYRDEMSTPFDQLVAFFAQRTLWLREVEEAAQRAAKNPRGIA